MADKVPGKAWVVVFCGTAVNLCLGILYAWSVWTKALISVPKGGPAHYRRSRGRLDLSDQCGSGHAVFVVRHYLRLVNDPRRPDPG